MKQNKGFAVMTPEQKKEIASAGGRAAHAQGKAYKFSSEAAKVAGQKGGRTVSQNREHMATIGQKGGQARSRNLGNNKFDDMIARYDTQHGNQ